ncbi:MAG: AlkZ family DNA glycosylase [Nocardia sp.]|nr:AlkZ family DNA glycosylase [Nocardia sp.]
MRSVSVEQRRARLARRHRLTAATLAREPSDIAASMRALHATDPATVHLSVRARSHGLTPADVEKALYDDRILLRMLAMRRTMFVVPVESVPILQAAIADPLAAAQRRTYLKYLREAVAGDAERWLADVAERTHRELLERGSATAAELSAAVPELRTQVDTAPGKPYSKPTAITGWVLLLLGCEGLIVRGRPTGGWTSTRYTWAPRETWLAESPQPVEPRQPVETDTARTELARRWLHTFGPAPITDLIWWTGWTRTQTRRALSAVDVTEVDLDAATGLILSDDTEPDPDPEPWAALLPALDPTPMGWKDRNWFLGPHGPALFDTTGNIGPSIWVDGRIVGGWAQRADGEIVYRLLEDVGAHARAQIDAECESVTTWFGDVCAIPRFRTPLERELSS